MTQKIKKSNHYGDTYIWIERVIDSCMNVEQLYSAEKIVDNFSSQLFNKFPENYYTSYHYKIISPLMQKVRTKMNDFKN